MKKVLVNSISILIVALALLALPAPQAAHATPGPRCYVDADAPGPTRNGNSWETAYTEVYLAQEDGTCQDIWVAAGFYTPDPSGGALLSIGLWTGLTMYGGFAGGETSLSQRDWETNVTILSGDVDHNDTNTDGNYIDETVADIQGTNSTHVVSALGSVAWPITSTTVLDGFTITGGAADGGYAGGGLSCESSGSGAICSPTLANLTFIGNRASSGGGLSAIAGDGSVSSPRIERSLFKNNHAGGGGGLSDYVYSDGTANPLLIDVTFEGNSASYGGGAVANVVANTGNASPTFRRAAFSGNSATSYGGAVYNMAAFGNSSPQLGNVTFSGNSAGSAGGAMFSTSGASGSSSPYLTNVTLNGNSAVEYGGALFNWSQTAGAVVDALVYNVILWGDTAGSGSEIYNAAAPSSTASAHIGSSVVQGGCASIAGADCSYGGNLSTDPLLGPLARNGGAVRTMALLSGSPAINTGAATYCSGPSAEGVDARGVARPQGAGCDVGAFEYDQVFSDVPVAGKEWMERWIDAFYAAGITTGCGIGPLRYCPENNVTRAEMAVFVLRAKHGMPYTPPPVKHSFSDMPVPGKEWMEAWVDEFYAEGLTTGCGISPLRYCPENQVTRAEMAVFLTRAIHPIGFTPPPATGIFDDLPVVGKEWMEAWIEHFYSHGITTGCGVAPLRYCPENNTTRAEMAVFIDRAYALYP